MLIICSTPSFLFFYSYCIFVLSFFSIFMIAVHWVVLREVWDRFPIVPFISKLYFPFLSKIFSVLLNPFPQIPHHTFLMMLWVTLFLFLFFARLFVWVIFKAFLFAFFLMTLLHLFFVFVALVIWFFATKLFIRILLDCLLITRFFLMNGVFLLFLGIILWVFVHMIAVLFAILVWLFLLDWLALSLIIQGISFTALFALTVVINCLTILRF